MTDFCDRSQWPDVNPEGSCERRRPTFEPDIEHAIATVRADVARLHGELVRYGLVVWTGGNISGRVPGADLFVIKPSGVSYDDLTPENMILCDLDGNIIPGTPAVTAHRRATPQRTRTSTGTCRPSAGSCTRTRPTPSRGRPGRGDPCVITAMADEFGGPSRSAPSRSSATTRSDAASSRRSAVTAPGGSHAEPRSVHDRGGCGGCP